MLFPNEVNEPMVKQLASQMEYSFARMIIAAAEQIIRRNKQELEEIVEEIDDEFRERLIRSERTQFPF